MRLDHVIHGPHDLDDAATRLEQEHGLRFLRGVRHPGGTVNSIAPLEPPQYLELLAVELRLLSLSDVRHLQQSDNPAAVSAQQCGIKDS